MTARWTFRWRTAPAPWAPPPIEHRVTYAPHIRGSIRRRPSGRLYMEVRNGDALIAHDGPFPTLERALHECDRVVGAARVSWMYGFGKKGKVG